MSKTIEGIKDEVAIEYGWKSWKSCYGDDGITNTMIDEVAERYAQSQTQELQEQNAELVDILSRIVEKQFDSKYSLQSLNNTISEAKELLTKYNHLKSNTNG